MHQPAHDVSFHANHGTSEDQNTPRIAQTYSCLDFVPHYLPTTPHLVLQSQHHLCLGQVAHVLCLEAKHVSRPAHKTPTVIVQGHHPSGGPAATPDLQQD